MSLTHLSTRWFTLLLAVALFSGCQTRQAPEQAGQIEEQSVRPGINVDYLKPDLSVPQWVERFEREGREVYEQRHDIVQAIKLRRGAVVADIGAGTGLFTTLLADAVGPWGKVYAVDIVPAFLGHIQQKTELARLKNVETVLCTERSVNLKPGSIDVAFICDTYHHFEYPRSTLASIYEALRPGGQIFLVEFKRVPGESSEWILSHVRAGQEVFAAEIEEAGFKQVEKFDFLKDNYILRFQKK